MRIGYMIILSLLCSFTPLSAHLESARKSLQIDATPYMISKEHPFQRALDSIFTEENVLQDSESFARAGFVTLDKRVHNNMRVAKHEAFPGYLFKLFLDSESPLEKRRSHNANFIRRCFFADYIRQLIRKGAITLFTVPDKWLYELPFSRREGKSRLILIATEMHLVSYEETRNAWKTCITPQHLQELFLIKQCIPLSQTILENIPYTQEGTFAVIDTENRTYHTAKLSQYFSDEMRSYWEELVVLHQQK